jgi:hypothetical protein
LVLVGSLIYFLRRVFCNDCGSIMFNDVNILDENSLGAPNVATKSSSLRVLDEGTLHVPTTMDMSMCME